MFISINSYFFIIGKLVDSVIAADLEVNYLTTWFIFLTVAMIIITLISNPLVEKNFKDFENKVKILLFNKLLVGDYLSVNNRINSGELVHTIEKDSFELYSILSGRIKPILHMSISSVISLIGMIILSPLASVSFLILVLLAFYLLNFVYSYVSNIQKKAMDYDSKATGIINEMIMNFTMLKSYQLERYLFEKYEKKRNKSTDYFLEVENRNFKSMVMSSLLTNLPFIFLAIICIFMLKKGVITIGGTIILLTLSNQLQTPILSIGSILRGLNLLNATSSRVLEVLRIPDQKNGIEANLSINNSIEFCQVSFSYDNRKKVIDNLSFKVINNDKLWIQGKSGKGKSTILKLIQRLIIPDSGGIYLNGIDTRKWDVNSLKKIVALMEQEPFLVNDIIFNNIKLAKPFSSDKEVVTATEKAGVMEFVEKLNGEFILI